MKKSLLQNIVIWLTAAVIFIVPLKFAGVVGIPEVPPMFPRSLIPLWVITWPPLMFAPFAAILLIISAICMPPDFSKNRNLWICAGLWMLTYGISFVGCINASTYIFPYIEMIHLGGLMCFMLAASIILSERPEAKTIFIIALTIGVFVTLLLGIDQFISGFKDTMAFIHQREIKTGVDLDWNFKLRVADVRVFSTFASSNSLGGFILLTFPAAFAVIYLYSGRIEPSRISRPLFLVGFGLLAAFIFGYTCSRAAFLSLIFMVGACIVLFKVNRKLKIAICILLPLTLIIGTLFISTTVRSFASMQVRIDYILSSAKLMAVHPFFGTGWGDFFHDYMTIKSYPTSEAPHMPHNIVMAFAGQTGVFGGLAVLSAILWPIYTLWRKLRHIAFAKIILSYNGAIFCGLLAFFIHGMFDVHLQVPANMATALLLSLLAMTPDTTEKDSTESRIKSGYRLKLLTVAVCLVMGALTFYNGLKMLRYQEAFERLADLCDRRTKSPQEFMSIPADKVSNGLRECVKLMPESPFPWFTAGDFMMSHGLLNEAEQMYLKALALSPLRAALHIRLYYINKMRGDQTRAMDHLKTALKLFPLHEGYIKLSKQENGQIEKAMP